MLNTGAAAQNKELRRHAALMEDLGDVWTWTKTAIEAIVPVLRVLKEAGIRFEELVERLEAGDTVREAVAALAAGDLLVEHKISGDAGANRRLAARYCRALRLQQQVEDAPELGEETDEDEAPEVDLSPVTTAPPAPAPRRRK